MQRKNMVARGTLGLFVITALVPFVGMMLHGAKFGTLAAVFVLSALAGGFAVYVGRIALEEERDVGREEGIGGLLTRQNLVFGVAYQVLQRLEPTSDGRTASGWVHVELLPVGFPHEKKWARLTAEIVPVQMEAFHYQPAGGILGKHISPLSLDQAESAARSKSLPPSPWNFG